MSPDNCMVCKAYTVLMMCQLLPMPNPFFCFFREIPRLGTSSISQPYIGIAKVYSDGEDVEEDARLSWNHQTCWLNSGPKVCRVPRQTLRWVIQGH